MSCNDYIRRRLRRYEKLRRAGRGVMVDAAPVRAHAEALIAGGMSARELAERSGVTAAALQRIRGQGKPASSRVHRDRADAILAVRPQVSPRRAVDATGTLRRLQALVAIGWTSMELAAAADVNVKHLSTLMSQPRVESATAARVAAVYDRLSMCPRVGKQAARSRARAERNGWVSPLAWVGVDIDDLAERPETGRTVRWGHEADPAEVIELVAGRKPADWASKASRAVAYGRLFDSGMSKADVAAHLRVSGRTAERARARWLAEQAAESRQDEAS